MGKGKEELAKAIPYINQNARARNLMAGWPRTIEFKLEGEETPFHIVIDQGQVELHDHPSEQADIVLSGDTEELAQVVLGKKDITHPLAHGQLVIEQGKGMEMVTLSRILSFVHRKWGG